MPTFSNYMAQLAQRRGIRRTLDAGAAFYRLSLPEETTVNVKTQELNPDASACVTSEPWPVPLTSADHATFLRLALNFNRNALHYLPCGILQDAANASLYRLTWWVGPQSLPDAEWRQQLKLFGTLSHKAWLTLPRPGQEAIPRGPMSDEQHVIFMP